MTDLLTRRGLIKGLSVAAPAAVALTAGTVRAQDAATGAVSTPAPTDLTPDQALDLLRAGNAEFVTDAPYRGAEDRARRLEIAQAQHPFAVLVGCSDSRVPPELLFGRGLGELFIIRVAGNTVDPVGLGSIEYAVAELGVPLIVVLGHERCGAVHAAVNVVEANAEFPGSIGRMVEPIVPAVLRARADLAEGADEAQLLDAAVHANVERVVAGLKVSGPVLEGPLAEGRLRIVGARYDLEDGAVTFFEA